MCASECSCHGKITMLLPLATEGFRPSPRTLSCLRCQPCHFACPNAVSLYQGSICSHTHLVLLLGTESGAAHATTWRCMSGQPQRAPTHPVIGGAITPVCCCCTTPAGIPATDMRFIHFKAAACFVSYRHCYLPCIFLTCNKPQPVAPYSKVYPPPPQ